MAGLAERCGLDAPDATPLPSHPLERRLGALSVALLLTAVATLAMWQLDDPDTWWHLAAGRYITTHRTIPTHDVLSFTATERPWIDLQWGFQLLLFAVHSFGGVPALIASTAALAVGSFWILYRLLRPCGSVAATLALSLSALVVHERFMVRPEIVSFVLLVTYLTLLEHYPENGRRLWALVPLQVLWVNVHAVFVMGLVLVSGYAVGRTIMAVGGRDGRFRPSDLRRLWMVAAAATLAAVINPYGLTGALFPFKLLTRISTQKQLYGVIGEFSGPFSTDMTPTTWAYAALIGLTALTLAISWRQVRLDRLCACSAFLTLSLMARRNIGAFALVATPVAAQGLAALGQWARARRPTSVPARYGGTTIAVLLAIGLLGVIAGTVTNRLHWWLDDRREFGLGISPIDFPIGAVDFLERTGARGHVFNDLASGGYLTWRSMPVFIDGRLEVYDEAFFARYLEVLNQPDGFAELAARYDIDIVVLYHVWPNRKPLIAALRANEDWALVYFDATGVVFVRNRSEFAAVARAGVGEIKKELTTAADVWPTHGLAAAVLPVHAPYAHLQKGNLLLVLGQAVVARHEFEAALRVRPQFDAARVGLGYAYWDSGQRDAARAEWQRVLQNDPQHEGALAAVAAAEQQQ